MKIFVHTGKGHYIGSVAVVAAENLEEAEKKVRLYLDNSGLKEEELSLSEKPCEGVIYFHNGDY